MSIARAFTTKRTKRDSPDTPQRSLTTKQSAATGSIRNKISSPVELLSTTNMLSYNAPDLYPASSPSAASHSTSEASDSDHKSISSVSTPPSSPDAEKGAPQPNHLSCYFNPSPGSGLAITKSTPDLKEAASSAPSIPSRAPSHTKHSHESLSHKKSMSKVSSLSHKSSAPSIGTGHRSTPSTLRSSLQMFNGMNVQAAANNKHSSQTPSTPSQQTHAKQPSISITMDSPLASEAPLKPRPAPMQGLPAKPNQQMPPIQSKARSQPSSKPLLPQSSSQNTDESHAFAPHPFGNELAQVTELAEEFSSGKMDFADEESAFMMERGLCIFLAEDYMSEIQGLFIEAFGDIRAKAPPVTSLWI